MYDPEMRKDCPMRGSLGNRSPVGGFCIDAVSDEICDAVHNAYDQGFYNALKMLKEQEPIAPGLEQDVDGIYSTCGKCKTKIWKMFGVEFDIKPDAMPKFCPNCGQEVKWNA